MLTGTYWIDKKTWHEFLKKQLTLRPVCVPGQFASPIKVFYNHSNRNDIVGIPRFLGLSMFGPPLQDYRTQGLFHDFHKYKGPDLGLRELQVQAVTQTVTTLQEWGGASILADCGFGKTRLALGLIQTLKVRTLILCNRSVLMQQWKDVIESMTQWSISWLQGKNSLQTNCLKQALGALDFTSTVCIGSIETLLEMTNSEFFKSFGLVIVDEAHHIAAATLVHALPMLPCKYVVGLSATPDRRDGLEYALYWLLGPTSFVYQRLPSVTNVVHSVEVLKYSPPLGTKNMEKMYSNGQLAFAEMMNSIAEDTLRNTFLVEIIQKLIKNERKKIIVVSALVNHCKFLHDAIQTQLETEQEVKVSMCLMAGKFQNPSMAKDKSTRVVFATYSLLEEGYDDPALDTLVLCTPRSRIQQTIGRIERSHEGKLRPLVVDIVDEFSFYPNMFRKRQAFYKSRGFLIHSNAI